MFSFPPGHTCASHCRCNAFCPSARSDYNCCDERHLRCTASPSTCMQSRNQRYSYFKGEITLFISHCGLMFIVIVRGSSTITYLFILFQNTVCNICFILIISMSLTNITRFLSRSSPWTQPFKVSYLLLLTLCVMFVYYCSQLLL